jgi:DNA end-binding protein Ku
VPKKEIDELYQNSPYYLAPDGEVGQQAFAVRKEGMVALGRVVFTSREHVIALEPRGKGLLGITLRYPYEVRKEDEYFEDIPDEKIPKDMLELASHIVETKSGHFEPEKFEDHYEDALKELLKKKQAGEKIEAPKERAPAKVINLMDALRRSVETERGGSAKRQAPSVKARSSSSPHPAERPSPRPIRPKRAAVSRLFARKRGCVTLLALKSGDRRSFRAIFKYDANVCGPES